jgi:hypothetical protein
MPHAEVSDELWEDFHTVVNMTSGELEDWLRVEGAEETTEALPDQAGPHLGRRVLAIRSGSRGESAIVLLVDMVWRGTRRAPGQTAVRRCRGRLRR